MQREREPGLAPDNAHCSYGPTRTTSRVPAERVNSQMADLPTFVVNQDRKPDQEPAARLNGQPDSRCGSAALQCVRGCRDRSDHRLRPGAGGFLGLGRDCLLTGWRRSSTALRISSSLRNGKATRAAVSASSSTSREMVSRVDAVANSRLRLLRRTFY